MSLLIPFANPLGPHSGPSSDGALHSVLPRTTATGLSSAIGQSSTRVLRGNADAAGSVTWQDVTTAAGSDTQNDVSIFDAVNPNKDLILMQLAAGDSIESMDFYQDTAGVFTGTVVANVFYRNTAGAWVDAAAIVTPNFSTTGIKRVRFTPINYSDVGLVDDPIDSRNNPQLRGIYLSFSGITAVTTAPIFRRAWKRSTAAAAKIFTEFTGLTSQGTSPNFTAWQFNILPLIGDVSVLGCDAPFAKMYVRIVRPRDVSFQTELIYSTGSGNFAVVPAANVILGSASVGDEIWTSSAQSPLAYVEDIFIPPSDWAKNTIVDKVNASFDKYWFGWRYTADAVAPALILNASIEFQCLGGVGSVGITASEAKTYTKVTAFVRQTSATACVFVVANLTTGKSASVTIAANTAAGSSAVSLAVSAGDKIAVQQLSGDDVFSIADGFIELS